LQYKKELKQTKKKTDLPSVKEFVWSFSSFGFEFGLSLRLSTGSFELAILFF